MMFSACSEGTDFDIDYTPIAPIGGQYALNIEKGYDPSKTDAEYWDSNPSDVEEICKVSDGVFCFLSNTTDYDKDKAWIRIGNYSTATDWAINAKVSINMSDYILVVQMWIILLETLQLLKVRLLCLVSVDIILTRLRLVLLPMKLLLFILVQISLVIIIGLKALSIQVGMRI